MKSDILVPNSVATFASSNAVFNARSRAPLKPETDYFLLATFTESAGDSVTRFATAKTGKAEEGTKAVFGKPRARVEFNTPEMIDIYSPVVGDVF